MLFLVSDSINASAICLTLIKTHMSTVYLFSFPLPLAFLLSPKDPPTLYFRDYSIGRQGSRLTHHFYWVGSILLGLVSLYGCILLLVRKVPYSHLYPRLQSKRPFLSLQGLGSIFFDLQTQYSCLGWVNPPGTPPFPRGMLSLASQISVKPNVLTDRG
jgi:hypothetical protein